MGLAINKGATPAPAKVVKKSRAQELMEATAALAATQLPDEDTMTANEGERPPGGVLCGSAVLPYTPTETSLSQLLTCR